MLCSSTEVALRACTPLPLAAMVTSCRLVRCWLYMKETEAPVDNDRAERKTGRPGSRSGSQPMTHSRLHEDDGEDLRAQILRIEAYIEEHALVVERCRKIIVVSKFAAASGGILILAM